MSEPFLPSFLQGNGQESVDKATAKAAKAVAKGKPITEALHPTSSPDSQRSTVPIYLARVVGGEGFHVSGLLPQVYDAWMTTALKLDDPDFEKAIDVASAIYADFLARCWGVLCALTYDAFIWFRPGYSPDEDLDPGRIRMFLEALQREGDWLRSLDGRFTGALTEKPNHPWQVNNVLSFLAARNKLPAPTSWTSWDATVDVLLKRYRT